MQVKDLNFRGARLHFVQIGLGTNSTFIQNAAGDSWEWDKGCDWLLQAASETRRHKVRGVAVEPVSELVDKLRGPAEHLPYVELVQVAMGEHEIWGEDVSVLSLKERDMLLQQVPQSQRENLKHDLEYILNMSSVGAVHPWVPGLLDNIHNDYHIKVDVEKRRSDVWTWERLSKQCMFHGCEVLLIDTEGYDTQILRSLITYCMSWPDAWPDLIQFETMGHCDRKERCSAEWDAIKSLEAQGYVLVHWSGHNSHLVFCTALRHESRLQDWVGGWSCSLCRKTWQLPYTTETGQTLCRHCARTNGSWSTQKWSTWDWSH